MSGKKIRFTLGGDEYEMPEDEGLQEIARLGNQGIQVEATRVPDAVGALAAGRNPPPDGEAPQLETPPGDPMTSPDAPSSSSTIGAAPEPQVTPAPVKDPNAPPSFMDWISSLADADKRRETLAAAPLPGNMANTRAAQAIGGGLEHGMSWGAQRAMPGGYGEFLRELDDQSRAASPPLYQAGDVAGGLLSSGFTPASSAAAPARGVMANLGRIVKGTAANTAEAGAQGFVRGYSDSASPDDANQRLSDGVDQATADMRFAAPVAGAAQTAGAISASLGRRLGAGADNARVHAWGIPKDDISEAATAAGKPVDDYMTEFVRRGEQAVPPNLIMPLSPGAWQKRALEAGRGYSGQIAGAIDDATAAGAQLPHNPRGQVAHNLFSAADAAYDSGAANGRKLATALDTEAAAVAGGPQFTDPHEIRAQKGVFDRSTYKAGPGTPESFAGQASAAAGNEYRQMLRDYVAQAGPAAADRFARANQNYGVAADIAKGAGSASAGQWASGGPLSTLMASGAGAGVGFILGGYNGALGGAAAGYAARKSFESPDFAANMGRRAQDLGTGISALADAPIGPLTASVKGARYGQESYDRRSLADESRGYQMGGLLKAQLARDPGALGPYATQLSAAKNDMELEATAERLARQDPNFARLLEHLRSQ